MLLWALTLFAYAEPICLAFQPIRLWPSYTNGDRLRCQTFPTTVSLHIWFILSETVSPAPSSSQMACLSHFKCKIVLEPSPSSVYVIYSLSYNIFYFLKLIYPLSLFLSLFIHLSFQLSLY